MTWTTTGSLIQANNVNSFSLTPAGTGHLILLEIINLSNSTVVVNSLSSTNVTWTQIATRTGANTTGTASLFSGKVTAASAATVTLTWSGTAPATSHIDGREFITSLGAWVADVVGILDVASPGTNAWPTITPSGSNELYWGNTTCIGVATAGSTTGYVYTIDSISNGEAYNLSVSAASHPVWGSTNQTLGIVVLMKDLTPSQNIAGVAAQVAVSVGAGLAKGYGRFPASPLGITVELLLGGVWVDISTYVQQRADISITSGEPDETAAIQPATMSLTLNNRHGDFSPKNSAGAFYPNLGRNIQIRITAAATSSAGIYYQGYRFWGEVSSWPPQWDVTGVDVYVTITAGGVLRRYMQGGNVGSSLRRFYMKKTDATRPIAYWPMEDATSATMFANLITPGASLNWTPPPAPTLASDSTSFGGSDPLPLLNTASLTAFNANWNIGSNVVFRFLLSVPAAGSTNLGYVARLQLTNSPNLDELIVHYGTANGGELWLTAAYGGVTVLTAANARTNINGVPLMISVEQFQVGSNLILGLSTMNVNDTTQSSTSNLYTGGRIGAPDFVQFDTNGTALLTDVTVGHATLQYAWESMVTAQPAIIGHLGETGGARFARLCAEEGIGGIVVGDPLTTPQMGPQGNNTLIALLQEIQDADQGALEEARDMLGLYYHPRISMMNQTVALTLDYSQAQLAGSLQPAYDDLLTRNDVTVSRNGGSVANAVLTSGALSTQLPPNGVGDYAYSLTANVSGDDQVAGLASRILAVGTVDEYRYPVVTVDLARSEVAGAGLFDTVPTLRPGSYFRITNPPSWVPESPVRQLARGFTETMNVLTWTISINGVPESVWESNFLATAPSGSVDNAGFEGSAGTWAAVPGTGNCTVAQTAAQAHSGTKSLAITSSGSGPMSLTHALAANVLADGLPVSGGSWVYLSCWFRTAVTSQVCNLGVRTFDSAGTVISTFLTSVLNDSTSGWSQGHAYLQVDATAYYALAYVQIQASAGSEVHYIDDLVMIGGGW
jgi:hypothetical protein